MVRNIFILAVLAFSGAWVLSRTLHPASFFAKENIIQYLEKRQLRPIGCGTDWQAIETLMEELEMPLVQGSGSHQWKISTHHDSAQIYFNQGINMYYSFHIIEAMASFKKAMRFDPDCPMLYWAEALAYGPNINDLGYIASPDALHAVEKAKLLLENASPIEKALIGAMAVRYTADSTDATRAKLNADYTDMMKKAYAQYPTHSDIQALYADAMMLEHPWDLWNNDGSPKPWTPLIRQVLEALLATSPNHPGANHYYIHVMEPSPFAALALPSADRLAELTPALSHTVHMPSHIYLRTGHFNKGVAVNEKAVQGFQAMLAAYSPVAAADFLYAIHNLHMQTNVAMLAGRAEKSKQSATATVKSIPPDYLQAPAPMGSAIQYIYMVPTLVNIRFGNWDELLNAPKPDESMTYANILFHFGKGMALAHQARNTEAGAELKQMQSLMKDSGLLIPFAAFSPAIEGARVAENLLAGSIALSEKDYAAAEEAFTKAASVEENMVYTEPRDWLLNPKPYLGNALLFAGKPKEAEAAFKKDLLVNAENGWSLYGLYQSLMAQQKNREADQMLARFKKAFDLADIKLSAAVM